MGDSVTVGVNVRRNVGLGVAVGVDLSVGLAVGSGDEVAVTVVAGVGVGLDVAVVGSTSRSVPESVARLPKDAGKCKGYSRAFGYY